MGEPPTNLHHAIQLFNTQHFFECHEVIEELWTPATGPRRLFLQSLIHCAVAFHHHQRHNLTGAIRQLHKALAKLTPYLPSCEGIDTARLHRDATLALHHIESGNPLIAYPRIHCSG